MRLLFPIVLVLLGFGLVGFLLTNPETRVSVTLGSTRYADIHLFTVVFVSLAIGALMACLIALVEGATLRLANRRLARELHKLEAELNYLRTQPPVRAEPDALEAHEIRRAPLDEPLGIEPPSAPVYGSDDADASLDPDEDAYSGGRAV